MQKTKLKELIISWFGSKTSYNLHKSENPDGLNLVPLDFDGSLQENGWTKLPNGLIIQWGTVTILPQQFPIAFHKLFGVQHIATSGDWSRIRDATTESFKPSVSNGYFFAIGV